MVVVWLKRLLLVAVVIAVGAGILSAFMPKPVRVDAETVESGPMEVAIRDDGRTRIRERYVVSTPISGRLRRIDLDVGDLVKTGETPVARMEPTSPTLLDPRALAQAKARVKAAQGRLSRSDIELERAKVELEQAQIDVNRQEDLRKKNATTESAVEQAQLTLRTKKEDVNAAEFSKEIAQYELELEEAGLLHVSREQASEDEAEKKQTNEFEIHSPITGRVLRVMKESSAVVAPGESLLEIGDPQDLEIVVDVLSSDAIRIKPGQLARLEQWGGEEPLIGVVRLVEPSGFTKISALGVEEQRVNVVLDFVGSIGERESLGDGYRVEASIIVWESPETISIPTGALFRDGENWAVFVIEEKLARLKHVEVGENNGLQVQIISGLKAGDQIVQHPSDQLADGVEVEIR